jgi:hypothetical protein
VHAIAQFRGAVPRQPFQIPNLRLILCRCCAIDFVPVCGAFRQEAEARRLFADLEITPVDPEVAYHTQGC